VSRSDRSGEEQLWVCGPDGSNPVSITSGRLRPSVGRWSPDGRSIVFNDAKEATIFVATQGGDGRWSTRATGVMGIHPVFSADGKWIYAGRKNAIVRVPAGGGEPVEAAARQGISLGMSSDGRSLYFMQEPAGTTLWGMDLASGAIAEVLDGIVPYCSSCWATAPGGIYYLGINNSDQQAVFFQDLAKGRSRLVVDYPEPLLPIGSGPFSLSPDGRYLLCVRVDPSNSDISRMEGFK
jgi:Tol biopolymer transport system component